MKILHLRRKDFQTTCWSGGTTTELFLYPPNGSYAARDFLFRVSSATLDAYESDFTPLPGVERFITPLDGSFVLTHPGTAPVRLCALDAPYRFSGATPTHCVGRATDFNLMLKGCDGKMEICCGETALEHGFTGLYPLSDLHVRVGGETVFVKKGEFLAVFCEKEEPLPLGDTRVIVCRARIAAK